MDIEYIKSLKKAYESYNLNATYELTKDLLNYIFSRVEENKENIEDIIKSQKLKVKYEDIQKVISEVKNSDNVYKSEVNLTKINENFVSSTYTTSVGLVIVETSDIIETIKYLIEAIKSRNVIVISDKEYEELDLKNYIMMIIKDALKKYGVDENLIDIYPYEETNYTYFDRVIVLNKTKAEITSKKESDKMYIYISDDYFKDKIDTVEGAEIISGDIYEAIDKINETVSKGAVIYTKDSKEAYKFINLVHSKNCFVNTSLNNVKEVDKLFNTIYTKKYIMYELKKLI